MADPLPLDAAQLGAAFRHLGGGCLFLIDSSGAVHLQNAEAEALAGPPDRAGAWLASDPFHDLEDKSRLTGKTSPLAHLADGRAQAPVLAGLVGAGGQEKRFRLTCTPVDGTGLHLLSASPLAAADPGTGRPAPGPEAGMLREMTHAMGNALGIIQLACDGLSLTDLPSGATGKLQDILRATTRANAILLDMERGALSPPEPAAAASLNVGALAVAIGDVFRRTLPATMRLDLDIGADSPDLMCQVDYSALELAVIEILAYGRAFAAARHPAQCRISLRVRRAGGAVELHMGADAEGPEPEPGPETGAPPAALDQTRALADLLGGGLTVSTEAARASACLALPAATRGAAADALEDPAGGGGEHRLDGYRLLIAENDTTLRGLLREKLAGLGAMVEVADSGMEAVRRLEREQTFDLVITNPVLRDRTTARAIADGLAAHSPATRVLVLTAAHRQAGAGENPDYGICLPKPVPIPVLVNAIRLIPPKAAPAG